MISTNININIIFPTRNFVNYFVPNIIGHKYDNQYKKLRCKKNNIEHFINELSF